MGLTDWLLKPLGWLFARHPAWRDAFGRMLLRIGPLSPGGSAEKPISYS